MNHHFHPRLLAFGKPSTTQDLAIDQFLTEHGAALSQSRALQRYNRAPAEPGEPLLTPLQKAQGSGL
jgi:hypothetical protein